MQKIKFRKVTASKYIAGHGYSITRLKDGTYSILKNNKLTKWGNHFQSVKAAENFLSNRNYLVATASNMPISMPDARLIYDIFCSKGQRKFGSKWYITSSFWIRGGYGHVPSDDINFIQFECSDGTVYRDADCLVNKLIVLSHDEESALVTSEIVAKSKTKHEPAGSNLMRVKSSNVWAIGFTVDNAVRNMGNIYVQFKGKNGGPGDTYIYYSVPLTLYRKFISAPSKGAFVWKFLRNNFQYSKLTGDKRGKLKNAIN